ncbi:hypothetical protein TU86_12520 [Pseudomonas weihenstephanensis]|uniref:Uncharacterized protein n=1 Tax=Pseudomonas weihenstephanensis TaxID=1608994 RepID=A0A0J6INW0_9PSED|nr:hypothetical protein TU86_12520 [Pseudomonas weihenstephanensis]
MQTLSPSPTQHTRHPLSPLNPCPLPESGGVRTLRQIENYPLHHPPPPPGNGLRMEPPLGRETYQNGRLWPRMRSTTLQTQLKSQLKTHSYRHINTSSKKQMPMPKQKQQITLPNFLKARLTGKESPQRATACEIGGLPCPPTLPCNSMASQWLENKLAWSNVFSPTTGSCLKTSRIFKTSQTPYPGPRFNLHPTVTSVGDCPGLRHL